MTYTYELMKHDAFVKVHIKSTEPEVSGWMLFWQTMIVKQWCQEFMVDLLKNCGFEHFTVEFPAFSVGMLFDQPIEFVIHKCEKPQAGLLELDIWKRAAQAILCDTSAKPLWMYSTEESLIISDDSSELRHRPYSVI